MTTNRMRLFPLVVYPAGSGCNMRCDYCMRDDLKPTPPMERQLAYRTMSQYSEASERRGITWTGGEPTLAGLQFFRDMMTAQAPGTLNCLQTNGTLLDHDWARFLKAWEWMVTISYDGLLNGQRGAGDRKALEALDLLYRYGVRTTIACVVSKLNLQHPIKILADLALQIRHGIQGRLCEVQFIPAKAPCPEKRHHENYPTGPQFANFLRMVYDSMDEFPNLRIRNFSAAYAAWNGAPLTCEVAPPMFPGGCGGYLVVNRLGDIRACDFWADDPDAVLGNVMTTTLDEVFQGQELLRFAQLKGNPHPACEPCAVRGGCNRGCPRDRWLVQRDFNDLSPMCAAHKFLAEVTKP